jgi:hypothetical protein
LCFFGVGVGEGTGDAVGFGVAVRCGVAVGFGKTVGVAVGAVVELLAGLGAAAPDGAGKKLFTVVPPRQAVNNAAMQNSKRIPARIAQTL